MKYKLTRYKSIISNKLILELTKETYGQWVVYQNRNPKFHINCFDFENESNQVLNSLLLAQQKPIEEVLSRINKKENINLSIEKPKFYERAVDSKIKEIDLESLPLEWVS
tara:strand:- start:135074 stop:135403 length:330 start_codon:yes stop_codon:yes gene_type:complete